MNSAYSLRSKAHAQAGQIAVAEREDDHENNVPRVMGEHNGQVAPGLHVTQNEEGDEYDTEDHQHRQQFAVFTRLRKRSTQPILRPQRHGALQSHAKSSLMHTESLGIEENVLKCLTDWMKVMLKKKKIDILFYLFIYKSRIVQNYQTIFGKHNYHPFH